MTSRIGSRSRSPARLPTASSEVDGSSEEDLTVDSSSEDDDSEVGRMPSSSEDCDVFPSVVEHRRVAEAEERAQWAGGVTRRGAAFAQLQATFAKERAAWDRNRACQDTDDVRSLIAAGTSLRASPAQRAAAGRASDLLEAALANARSRYKTRAADVAAKARAAMDAAIPKIGLPAIPPPAEIAQNALASAGPEPASVSQGRLRAEAEERRYLDKTAARQCARFAQLQAASAAIRASWQRRARLWDRDTVREFVSRAWRSGRLARPGTQVEIQCLASALDSIRDKYRTWEEDVASEGRRAMYAVRGPPGQRSEL